MKKEPYVDRPTRLNRAFARAGWNCYAVPSRDFPGMYFVLDRKSHQRVVLDYFEPLLKLAQPSDGK